MKKVMIIANHAGGLYKFRKELLIELIKKKYEVFILVPMGDENVENIKKLGVNVIDVFIDRRGLNPFKDIILFMKYSRNIEIIKPDIILTYTIKPNIYGGIVARIKKIPVICNITGMGSAFQKDNILRKILIFLYKIALKKSRKVFFQNKSNKQIFEKFNIINDKQAKLVPGSGVNLIDNSFEEYPNQNDIFNIIFVGRIMKEKGINEFLYMAKKMKEKYSNIEFRVFGEYEEEECKKLLDEYIKKNIVVYYGHQNEMHKFFKESNCIVLPSYHEGLSNVLLEAASTGRPAIASNIPGCSEIIDDNQSGYIFEVKNEEDLTKKVSKFIELSYDEKVKMGKKARDKVEKEFDRKLVIDSYMEEINKILN